MTKGYPRSRFEIIDQTNVQEIPQTSVGSPIPMAMAAYTSDKGPEEWRLLFNLSDFTAQTGPISFLKHGQAQLTVAEELRSGACVLCKRMVSSDATLANVTIRARVLKIDNVSYVYYYANSVADIQTFDDACTEGSVEIDTAANELDVPLFTVTPMGRGVSNLFFRIVPEYTVSRSASYVKYSFEIYENQELLESIIFTMNPDIIIDGVSQAMNPKVKANSKQVKVNLYEDGLYKLISALAETTELDGTRLSISQLINMDFINGTNTRGTTKLGGIVVAAESGDTDLWTSNKPDSIGTVYELNDATGVPMDNGSYGKMGATPISESAEYTDMLLEVFGKKLTADESSGVSVTALFDPVIYDQDAYKVDFICDCDYDPAVKQAIINMVEFRGDCVFLMDLGTKVNSIATIRDAMDTGKFNSEYFSNYVAIYHNWCKIYDPYTSKQITVTIPYLLASRMVSHISEGVGLPFAGILHNITFPEIVENSLNFLPVEVPGLDQKQLLVDMNVNYISFYDGTPVMETMYVNSADYTQLSYLHNIMAVQDVIKTIRTKCPRTRYTFLSGTDLQNYIDDATAVINQYNSNFKSISIQYMADEKYESNNIFYATLKVQFKNFVQEEYFRVIAIS
jgi:hypothetical protein